MPVDHLFAAPVMLDAIREMGIPDLVIVSPDAGGVARARAIAKRLDVDLAIVDKRRVAVNEAEVMNVIGDVRDRDVLIVDDIIDTAGTLVKTVGGAARAGRRGVSSPPASTVSCRGRRSQRIEIRPLEALLVTDTTPIDDKLQRSSKLRGALGGAAAGRGDPPHPRQQLGDGALRLTRAAASAKSSRDEERDPP